MLDFAKDAIMLHQEEILEKFQSGFMRRDQELFMGEILKEVSSL